ncbi:MAG TPA: hypothetical protein VJB34_07365 [Bdellovibrionota bacterium]|nr:hypothetical protein [Bdellovibrionota bacterium]
MKKAVLSFMSLVLFACPVLATEGTVNEIKGTLAAHQRGELFAVLEVNQDLVTKDTVFTGSETLTHLSFKLDKNRKSYVTVFPETNFHVQETYTQPQDKPLHLKLFNGFLRVVAPKNPPYETVKIETPEAVVGVRGTEFGCEKFDALMNSILYESVKKSTSTEKQRRDLKKIAEVFEKYQYRSGQAFSVTEGKVYIESKYVNKTLNLGEFLILLDNGKYVFGKVDPEKLSTVYQKEEEKIARKSNISFASLRMTERKSHSPLVLSLEGRGRKVRVNSDDNMLLDKNANHVRLSNDFKEPENPKNLDHIVKKPAQTEMQGFRARGASRMPTGHEGETYEVPPPDWD